MRGLTKDERMILMPGYPGQQAKLDTFQQLIKDKRLQVITIGEENYLRPTYWGQLALSVCPE